MRSLIKVYFILTVVIAVSCVNNIGYLNQEESKEIDSFDTVFYNRLKTEQLFKKCCDSWDFYKIFTKGSNSTLDLEKGNELLLKLRTKYSTFTIYKYVAYFNKQKYLQNQLGQGKLKITVDSKLDDIWREATELTRKVFRFNDVSCDPIPRLLESYMDIRRFDVLRKMFQSEHLHMPNDFYVRILDAVGVWPDCRKGYLMDMPASVASALESVFKSGKSLPEYVGISIGGGDPIVCEPENSNKKKGNKITSIKGKYSNILGGNTVCRISPSALMGEYGGTFGCVRFKPKSTDCDVRINGKRCNKYHNGLDIQAEENSEVYTAYKGVVSIGEDKRGLGKYVAVQSPKEEGGYIVVMYCHLNGYNVLHGDRVNSGDLIGRAGHTGNADERNPHVHIIVKDNGWGNNAHVNPGDYLETK